MISKAYQSRHKGITEQTQKKSIADTKAYQSRHKSIAVKSIAKQTQRHLCYNRADTKT